MSMEVGGDAISGTVGDSAQNVVIGTDNEQHTHYGRLSPTQIIYGNDNLSLALSNISTDLKILSRDFASLNQQVIALGMMRRDIDEIRQLFAKLAETEPALRDEFSNQITELRGSTSFHFSALWIAIALLMFGVALALFLAWPR